MKCQPILPCLAAAALMWMLPSVPAQAAQVVCTPSPGFTHCIRVTYSGGDQSFVVPPDVTNLYVRAWGAGGGGSNSVYYTPAVGGGGGGYVDTRLSVTAGASFTVRVGQGGVTGSSLPTFGGGGTGGLYGGDNQIGGSGGGYSAVFSGTTPILIAGGGGGGTPGGGPYVSGGGGGLTGNDGTAPYSGLGGSQVAGGAPGITGPCGILATAGSYLTGGNGASTGVSSNGGKENGGGGGGGYYGGGGGACQDGPNWNGGGGGGSSYFGHASVLAGSTAAGGDGVSPHVGGASGGATSDQHVSGIGRGAGLGGVGTAAGNGMVVLQWVAPKVRIIKTTTGGVGTNAFTFTHSGLSTLLQVPTTTSTISVTGAGSVASTTYSGEILAPATIAEALTPGYTTIGISCIDTNAASSGNTNPLAVSAVRGNRSITIPGAAMRGGGRVEEGPVIDCTFTNEPDRSISGRVFLDNGAGGGVANDGIQNGGEVPQAGIPVRLTNCSGTTYASGVTDSQGYSLEVPAGTAAGVTLCVEQTNQAGRTSTGASLGPVALPSGTPMAVGGTSYTYSHAASPDRIAFTWSGIAHRNLNFGDVGNATFAAGGARTGQPGTTVAYSHTFTAQTAGSVSFTILSSTPVPALAGWGEKIFLDTGCTGNLQPGAQLLYPPALPAIAVTAGQQVCLIVQQFIPASALGGNSNTARVQATFQFANAAPVLSAHLTLDDVTTVSPSALDLRKEVRNVTQAGSFGLNNQARSQEVLEYRLTYTNNGSTPVTSLIVNDATPGYTTFVSALAGTTPATLTGCQKQTPANAPPNPLVACSDVQATGGAGTISFQFTGSLQPGASGDVLFRVRVD